VHGLEQEVGTVQNYCRRRRIGGWLTLSGKSGCGKSMLAACGILDVAGEGVDSHWVNVADLLVDLSRAIDARTSSSRILGPLLNAPFLVVDDLGAVRRTDYVHDVLYALLNHREEHQRPTLITTNLTIADVARDMGSRIADRILRNGEVLSITASSWALRRPT
jgi:DNA replication protein DnaC